MPHQGVVSEWKVKAINEFNDVFYSTTYGGEALSLAASIAVINEMKTNAISTGCLGGVGGRMLLIMAAVASGPWGSGYGYKIAIRK